MIFWQEPPVLPRLTIFKSADPVHADLLIATKEATVAFHTVVHDLTFKTADCSPTLNCKLSEPNNGISRTKCEAVVLTSRAKRDVHEDMIKSNFVSITFAF